MPRSVWLYTPARFEELKAPIDLLARGAGLTRHAH